MRICIHTFGCQMNKLDSELVAEALAGAGHTLTADEAEADAVLFNTCSVRDHAEQRVLSRLAQLRARKERRPDLLVGVMGCMAQRLAEELLAKEPTLDLVCGTRAFPRIARLLEEAKTGPVVAVDETPLAAPGALAPHGRPLHAGPQGFVSVMRGCDNVCSYCIVPHVRGREESRPVRAVTEEVRALTDRGATEVTLLGQNIDAYGRDLGTDLAALLRAVHANEALLRIRFVTSHPKDITGELVRTVAELPRVAPHFHMPAQSGSTRVLRAMRRGYTREQYDGKLDLIHRHAPGALVASDFIVGFPGETEADFAATLDLVERAQFQNSYVFKYSPRPGTPAAALADDVPAEEKKRRNLALLAAQEAVGRARAEALRGSLQEILVEGVSPRDAGRLIGRTGTNLICVFDAPPEPEASALAGRLVMLEITGGTPLTLFGRRVA
jgi:tRNA-2-methylthio-N6-dimethylallyladenosine synthase